MMSHASGRHPAFAGSLQTDSRRCRLPLSCGFRLTARPDQGGAPERFPVALNPTYFHDSAAAPWHNLNLL
ncbi:MAG: hypothetical protein ACLP2P_04410 [Desulfobaccales bacterium]